MSGVIPGRAGRRGALALIALLFACVPWARGSVEKTYGSDDVDEPPRLIGCRGYTDPLPGAALRNSFRASFVVQPDGTVDEASVRVSRLRGPRVGDTMRRVTEIAASCTYIAGTLDGEPVRVRSDKMFYFGY